MTRNTSDKPRFTTSGDGRDWYPVINITTARAMRDDLGFDPMLVIDDTEQFLSLLADEYTFGGVLWYSVRRQAEAANVGVDAFYDSLEPEDLEAARLAIDGAVERFFSDPARRRVVGNILKMTRETMIDLIDEIDEVMKDAATTKAKEIRNNLEDGALSRGTPASSALTQET